LEVVGAVPTAIHVPMESMDRDRSMQFFLSFAIEIDQNDVKSNDLIKLIPQKEESIKLHWQYNVRVRFIVGSNPHIEI
jgi:hypothetical protein